MLTGWGQRLVEEGYVPPHVDRVLSKPPKLRELREALAIVPTQDELNRRLENDPCLSPHCCPTLIVTTKCSR